ncbi:MAG: HgcAB-associated protein [bacterium]
MPRRKRFPELLPTVGTCCRVESLVSVDERGQMVLPKDIREKAGIVPGEKLALVLWEKEGEVCCIVLMRTQALSAKVREMLDPVVQNVMAGQELLKDNRGKGDANG